MRQTVTPPCLSKEASALPSGRQYKFAIVSATSAVPTVLLLSVESKFQSATDPSRAPDAKFVPLLEKVSDVRGLR